MKNLHFKAKLISFTLCALSISLNAGAAGLGKLTIKSALGDPLVAEVALSATPEELQTLVARIAPSEVYAEQGVDYSPSLSSVHLEIARRPDNTLVIHLDSPKAHGAPFPKLLIQTEWANGRSMRAYNTEPNVPVFGQQQPVAANDAPLNDIAPATSQSGTLAETTNPVPTNVATPKENATAPSARANVAVGSDGPVSDAKVNVSAPVVAIQAGKAELQPDDDTLITRKGDTLSSISSKLKVDGLSTAQILQRIYQTNKSAFIGHDMNRLKVGQKIHLPSQEELRELAQKDIQIESSDWAISKMKLAEQAQKSDLSMANTAQNPGKIMPIVQPQPNAASDPDRAQDVVKLSATSSRDDASMRDNSRQAEMLADDATARQNEIRQIEESRSLLESQVENIRALQAIKNKMLADKMAAATPNAADGNASTPKRLSMFELVGALMILTGVSWLYFSTRRRRLNGMNLEFQKVP